MSAIGRLCMRHEGTMWNAYYAMPDTEENMILLGSIAMRFIEENPEMKSEFLDLMKTGVERMIKEITGHDADFERSRPSSVRSGHA